MREHQVLSCDFEKTLFISYDSRRNSRLGWLFSMNQGDVRVPTVL